MAQHAHIATLNDAGRRDEERATRRVPLDDGNGELRDPALVQTAPSRTTRLRMGTRQARINRHERPSRDAYLTRFEGLAAVADIVKSSTADPAGLALRQLGVAQGRRAASRCRAQDGCSNRRSQRCRRLDTIQRGESGFGVVTVVDTGGAGQRAWCGSPDVTLSKLQAGQAEHATTTERCIRSDSRLRSGRSRSSNARKHRHEANRGRRRALSRAQGSADTQCAIARSSRRRRSHRGVTRWIRLNEALPVEERQQ